MGMRQALSSMSWRLRARGRIVGAGFFIDPRVKVEVKEGAVLRLGRGVHVSAGASLVIRADTTIGPDVFIGRNVTLVAFSKVLVGEGTLIAENVSIHSENHRGPALSAYTSSPIVIGKRCWLCAGVVVAEGAEIGDATVVGANSVVTGLLPPGVVAGGTPARVLSPRRDLG